MLMEGVGFVLVITEDVSDSCGAVVCCVIVMV